MNKSFSASYINADANFKIYHLSEDKNEDRFHPILCLVQNLLQRGNPTDLSFYLQEQFKDEVYEGPLHLVSDAVPKWGNVIKGSDDFNQYPARKFYYDIVPKVFTEYPFLQSLMIPEVGIKDIVPIAAERFTNQQVDFYISQARLVIEVDGPQHRERKQQSLDADRDELFHNNGIQTVRIPSDMLREEMLYKPYIAEIKDCLSRYRNTLSEYQKSYNKCISKTIDYELSIIATIRLQIAIIQMCIQGMMSLDDKNWFIYIKNHEVSGYERNAIEDLFLWIENLSCMADIDFSKPEIFIEERNLLGEVNPNSIRIEMSVLERGTVQNTTKNWIYIYSDWFQDKDYFEIYTATPIKYSIYHGNLANESEYNIKRQALRFVLKNLFGFNEFRPGQERIVVNALQRRDTIGVLPTGSGKSLCYQLSVMMQPCISFCICPIKSLMLDQDMNLKNRGISRTAFISSDLSKEEKEQTQRNFGRGNYWFVFLSPERFQSIEFREYLSAMCFDANRHFGYAVIDEVHCISEWGHDFRVSYLNLIKTIRRFCPGAVLFGLTATASYNVLKNILVEFEMSDKQDVISIPSFTRSELNFKVIKCSSESDPFSREENYKKIRNTKKYAALRSLLDNYLGYYSDLLQLKGKNSRCGIVFTPHVASTHGCYSLALALKSDYQQRIEFYSGDKPASYFPPPGWPKGLEFDQYKKDVQEAFSKSEYTLLCATKAFGMGIDKPNVRYTIHYGIPSSLEALYQEAGRAGRDRKKATCTILYSPESESVQKTVNELLAPTATIEDIKEYLDNTRPWNDNDLLRQLRLMGNGLVPFEEEKANIEEMIEQFVKPAEHNVIIKADKSVRNNLQDKQRYIYHLSLIGIVDDWTVDWRYNCLSVDFKNYTEGSVLEHTQKYIRNYEADYEIKLDKNYVEASKNLKQSIIITALTVFWEWYYNNIIYSRKQALFNVAEASESYSEEHAEDFKEKMEAYFRLDDVTDMLGLVADEPKNITQWFDVINIDTIKRKKASNILMGLNRFLESYQHNVGLNYISGFMSLVENRFESINGKERLMQALNTIKSFKKEDREYVLIESAKVMCEVASQEALELFAEFYIANYPLNDTDRQIYKVQKDNYSLHSYTRRMLAYMLKLIGDTDYGKR